MPRLRSTAVRWLSWLVSPLHSPNKRMALALSAGVVLAIAPAVRFVSPGGRATFREPPPVTGAPLSSLTLGSALSWSRVLRTSADACPLTPAEEQDAVEKFDKLWPVLRHPRCLNCHGAVRPELDERQGKHLGGRIAGPDAFEQCQDCHDLRGWDTPPSTFLFTGRSARQLCMQFKHIELTPLQFVMHIYNDRGSTPFTEAAFRGDRALNDLGRDMVEESTGRPFQAEPPPMGHGEFLQLASDWANAVGERGWKATADCGCGRKKKAWTGTITGAWNLELGPLHVVENSSANVRFEVDTTYAPGPDVYWASVSGEIEWSTQITGECHASASGTVPIGLGADENPMATLSLQATLPGSPYMVSIGPWRDEHQPRFLLQCPNSPPLFGQLYGAPLWWNHSPPGMDSPDGKTLQGRYEMPMPGGTALWIWDLQLDEGTDDQ